jgi:hypothetical protein
MRIRSVSAVLCCAVAVALVPAAHAADRPGAPRLLINVGRSFQVRPAMIVLGTVAITGPQVSEQQYRAGRYGQIRWVRWSSEAIGGGRAWVPNGPGGAVRPHPATVRAWSVQDGRYIWLWWAAGVGSHRYQEWDKLMNFDGTYDWRLVRSTGNP